MHSGREVDRMRKQRSLVCSPVQYTVSQPWSYSEASRGGS